MLAKCFCPKHGKVDLDNIQIINGKPICSRCRSVLEFGKVMPRAVGDAPKKKAKKRGGKTKTKRRKG